MHRLTSLLGAGTLLLTAGVFTGTTLSAKTLYSKEELISTEAAVKQALSDNAKLSDSQLTKKLQILSGSASESSLKQEASLYQTLLNLRSRPGIDAGLKLELEALTEYKADAYVAIPDGPYDIETPAYQIGAAAKATLIHFEVLDKAEQFSAFSAGDIDGWLYAQSQAVSTDKSHNRMLALAAIKSTEQWTENHWQALEERLSQGTQPIGVHPLVLKHAAEQLKSPVAYEALLSASKASKDFTSLRRALPNLQLMGSERHDFLFKLMDVPSVAEPAIAELGRALPEHPELADPLFNSLADNRYGAAAAKALAMNGDDLVIQRLAGQLDTEGLAQRRALLALYLNGSAAAKGYLNDFLSRTDNAKLKREVAQWLN